MNQFWINISPSQIWINRSEQIWVGVLPVPDALPEFIALGLSRLAYQFTDSEKFKEFIVSFLNEYQELSDSDIQLLTERYLEVAVGVQLDGLGEIIGLDRPDQSLDVLGGFGFDTDPTALGFTSLSDLSLGGNFTSINTATLPIGDDLYRSLLRAQIVINQGSMTAADTTKAISVLFDGVSVRYDCTVAFDPEYHIDRSLSFQDIALLDLLPTLIGTATVTYTGV